MFKFYETPDVLFAEQDQFERDVAGFMTGEIHPVKFKGIRVAHGVYEQRQEHTYMLRIRCAAGGITPKQLKHVAALAKKYGSGEVHFTTRQEVQIHNVLIQDIMHCIRGLNEVGLSSRGGGGNTIRNILTSPDSGVSPEEVFDVDPYAMALTTRMIAEPDSWNLPRKFKTAFSHNANDTAITQATCLGFVAKMKDGQKGFEVYTAGGMGAKPMVGHRLLEWIPDTQVYHVTKAIKIMFDKHGNRRSKYSNRIKFLWKKLDEAEFLRLFHEEYDKIKDDASLNLVLPELVNAAKETNLAVEAPKDAADFEVWKQRYVSDQKQPGLVSIKLPLILGDLLEPDANVLCDFLDHFGDNTIRCDRAQNMRLRNIPEKYLGNAYNVIKSLSYTLAEHAPFIGNMINCTGAQTCKLGICLPRGLSTAIRERLIGSELNLDALTDFRLNMSGCPNTCGMHHVADLGFFGKIGRKSGNIYPAYNVLVGAKIAAGETQYAERVGEIPVKFIPDFVHDFLSDYLESKEDYESYTAYLEAEGKALIQDLLEKYKDVPELEADTTHYVDFGAKRKLSLEELGTAECSAGMFDMIGVDQKRIKEHTEALNQTDVDDQKIDHLYNILHASVRMLLVTRGLDAKTDVQAFEYFGKHFVTAGLITSEHQGVVDLGKNGRSEALLTQQAAVLKLAEEVNDLYKNMDDSLRFKGKDGKVINESYDNTVSSAATSPAGSADVSKDYRGVACPMNFVKTKLVLETMTSGQKLEILLDDGEPINNVPNSVKLEGHKILEQVQQPDSHWKVLIEKK